MKKPSNAFASLIALAGITAFAPAQADVGSDIAARLSELYNLTPKDCGSASKPAFLCSGVLLRATTPSTAYQFYSISPAAQAKGGVSMSYLRKDAKFQNLAFGLTSGFIFDEILANPVDHLQVLCVYPLDGATDRRTGGGCTDYARTTATENYCDLSGVLTAEQWVARFRNTLDADEARRRGAQCSFDVRDNKNAGTADAFYQAIRATSLVPEVKFNGSNFQENEVVVAPWKVSAPQSPAIAAAFHVNAAGLEGARLYQVQWFQATRQFLPVISLALPQTAQQDAKFSFARGSQAIQEVVQADACTRYVQSATWVTRFDAGFNKQIASLELVPTDCGRRILQAQTDNFMNELVASHYLQPEWINNTDNKTDKIASMRRQLVCNIVTARSRASWSLEPSRPLVTHAQSLAKNCDNA